MTKEKYEKPCIFEKDDSEDLQAGSETERIVEERFRDTNLDLAGASVRYLVKKTYKPERSKEAEESVRIWEILKKNGFNVPKLYFLTEEDGHKVIIMESLEEKGEVVESLHLKADLTPSDLYNFGDLIKEIIENLAHMHSLNISICPRHSALSPWFLKIKKKEHTAKLLLVDLSNLQLNENITPSQSKRDFRKIIKELQEIPTFRFRDYSLDLEEIYRETYEKYKPKEDRSFRLSTKLPGQKVRY